MGDSEPPPILTPDRRLRVFISSTMKELRDERVAVQRAIEDMRLHPVLFETGARPYPPREVYRAYLEQSDVFVGIYWESYGWVAPGMEISGLEDEFDLSTPLPRLVYMKEPARARDPELEQLLSRISGSGISYRRFRTAEELASLVRDDLAVLLTERFQTRGRERQGAMTTYVPMTTNRFVGRSKEMHELIEMVCGGARFVTITGPGGVGKSRLAIEVAGVARERFGDGAHIVLLENVSEPTRLADEIAVSLALPQTMAAGDHMTQLRAALRDRHLLLVLDNFEHVMAGAPVVTQLVESCDRIVVLITSRTLLRLRGEVEYALEPLDSGEAGSDALDLFLDRIRDPRTVASDEQMAAAGDLCARLDGLPLAIELAAARTVLLPPGAILERIEHDLDLLRMDSPDLPERQRTMRAAVAWSFDLLEPEDEAFLRRLSVFAGGFTLEAAEAVCDPEGDLGALDRLQNLIESSLVTSAPSRYAPRFRSLETIRMYASEILQRSGEADELAHRHAEHFFSLAKACADSLRGGKQPKTLDLLESEEANIYAAFSHLVREHRGEDVVRAGWSIWPFWWLRGRLGDGEALMGSALEDRSLPVGSTGRAKAVRGGMQLLRGDASAAIPTVLEALEEIDTTADPIGRAQCLVALGLLASVFEERQQVIDRLREGVGLLRGTEERWGLLVALNALSWMAVALEEADEPMATFEEGVALAQELQSPVDIAMATANLGGRVAREDPAQAASLYRRALLILLDGNIHNVSSHLVEKTAEMAVSRGQHDDAATFYGLAERLRDEAGELLLPAFQQRRDGYIERIRTEIERARFDALVVEGKSLGFRGGIERVLTFLGQAADR